MDGLAERGRAIASRSSRRFMLDLREGERGRSTTITVIPSRRHSGGVERGEESPAETAGGLNVRGQPLTRTALRSVSPSPRETRGEGLSTREQSNKSRVLLPAGEKVPRADEGPAIAAETPGGVVATNG